MEMRDVVGYEGRYAVTLDGKVWGHPKHWRNSRGANFGHNGKFLKPAISGQYLAVALLKDHQQSTKTIHRLVAIAYIPNPDNKPQINHKDGNKLNNHIDNLEWCTNQENAAHAYATGLTVGRTPKHDERCTCFRCHPERRGKGRVAKVKKD